MLNDILLHIGSAIIIVWGIAHLVPTRNIVAGFGDLSPDNTRIITMEWIAEGLTFRATSTPSKWSITGK
ncbi:MAG: hypothetical protein ACETWG_00590 [Candidatus Neomarinimicrobiota bacterium]